MYVSQSKNRNQCKRCHQRSKKGRKRPRRRQLETNKSCDCFVRDRVLNKKVADKYGLGYSWAWKVCKRLLEGESGERMSGSGRPRKTSICEDRFLIREATRERNPIDVCPCVPDLSKSLKEQTSTQISPRTVQRRLNEKNFKKFPKTKRPHENQVNRRKRLQFARCYLHWAVAMHGKRSSGLTNNHLCSAAKGDHIFGGVAMSSFLLDVSNKL